VVGLVEPGIVAGAALASQFHFHQGAKLQFYQLLRKHQGRRFLIKNVL
jgi:hypothetical protein